MAGSIYRLAITGALLVPAAWSLIFSLLALRTNEAERAAIWPAYVQRMRVLNLLAVPAWWSLWGALIESGISQNTISGWPEWVLLIFPLSAGIATARFIAAWTARRIEDRRLSIGHLLRLSLASTLASTIPLLTFALGIDAVYQRNFIGTLWLGCAAVLARQGRAFLREAEGVKPRLVKSGELFKRSFAMAKRMGVNLVGVFVYPSGKERLMNAHGGAGFVGMTDLCVHLFEGPQLDSIIGHELAHVQQNHHRKTIRIAGGVYLAVALLSLAVPSLPLAWRVCFKFCVILIPAIAFNLISQRFEFAADQAAVEATKDGEMAIKALSTLYAKSGRPASRSNLSEFLSSHPSLRRRMDAITRVVRVGDPQMPHPPA